MAVYLKTLKKHDCRQTCILNAAMGVLCLFLFMRKGFLIKRLKYYYYPNKVENESALHQKLLVIISMPFKANLNAIWKKGKVLINVCSISLHFS